MTSLACTCGWTGLGWSGDVLTVTTASDGRCVSHVVRRAPLPCPEETGEPIVEVGES